MSSHSSSPVQWFVTADNALLNADHIVRIYQGADGKVYADLTIGSDIELRVNAMADLRTMLAANRTL